MVLMVLVQNKVFVRSDIAKHWRKSRGGGWRGCILPLFGVGGWPVLFEDKITLNLTFIVKKLTFLTVKLSKTPQIARSLALLARTQKIF